MNSSALATDMNREPDIQASYLIELMQLHDANAAKQMAWDFSSCHIICHGLAPLQHHQNT